MMKFVVLGVVVAMTMSVVLAGETGKTIRPDLTKIVEDDAPVKLVDPNFGYEGHLGCFVAAANGKAHCMIVVHQFPDTSKVALGNTKMTYEGAKQLNNVPGYVFKTDFDGKNYPSKVFLSSEKVYFGGGISAYIAADYRDGTGWAWKLIPLRRMDIVSANSATE